MNYKYKTLQLTSWRHRSLFWECSISLC